MGESHVLTAPGKSTEDLFRSAVVALEIPRKSPEKAWLGTGFFVAPRIVATCAHVLSPTRSELPNTVIGSTLDNKEFALEPIPAWYFGVDADGLDLAFLWVAEPLDAPYVVLSAAAVAGDPLLAYGHPAGEFRGGQPATLQYAGPSRLVSADGQWEPQRMIGTPIYAGHSGSPVLNLRTGAVCGMLCLSNQQGSAHMAGAADILAHLPDEAAEVQVRPAPQAGRWLATLTDEQIHAGGWHYPGPRLREYLEDAVRAALHTSFSGSAAGDNALELSVVYIEQLAVRASQAARVQVTVRAAEVFGSAEHAFVVGGPGIGKSSLLRMGMVNLARAWLGGDTADTVPVRVQAADLIKGKKGLPELIARSVEADISAVGLVNSWPEEFFRTEPMAGVRWLVLIDGLDDIVDAESRRRVADMLAGIARSSHSGLYQFIIASRPLPAEELANHYAWIDQRYELRPFDSRQLRSFAERLLGELGAGDAAEAAEQLVRELGRAELRDIAHAPLIATMLCQLFIDDTESRLPASLTEIYEKFVERLVSPQYVAGNRSIHKRAEKAFKFYGRDAVRAAAAVIERSKDLIARLALARKEGSVQPFPELLWQWEADGRATIPPPRWHGFLTDILRRSGLLTEHHGDFVFIHDTIADYLAADLVVRDEARGRIAFEQLFYRRQRPWPAWQPPGWGYSYTRFLIALWPDQVRTSDALRQVAEGGGLAGCEFVVSLFKDGIAVDPAVMDAASATLARIASTSVSYGFAARRALALLGHIGARDWLAKVMTADRAGGDIRDRAAITLAEFGDARGADRLSTLAMNRDRDTLDRFDAYEALIRIEDSRAPDLLFGIFSSLTDEMGSYQACEYVVSHLGQAQGLGLLAKVAGSLVASRGMRESAAHTLARYGDPRGIDVLAMDASSRSTPVGERFAALVALGRLNAPHALSALRRIAQNDTLSRQIRLQVMELLMQQGDPQVPALLSAVVTDPLINMPTRVDAMTMLTEMRSREILKTLAGSASCHRKIRNMAIQAIISTADDSDKEILLRCARDSKLTPDMRIAAIKALDFLGSREVPGLAATLAQDASVSPLYQRQAARMTLAEDDSPGGEPDACPVAPEVDVPRVPIRCHPGNLRRQRVRILLLVALSQWPVRPADGHGAPWRLVTHPRCLDMLTEFAQDVTNGINARLAAARALIRFEDPRGQPLAEELASYPGEGVYEFARNSVDMFLALVGIALDDASHAWIDGVKCEVDVAARLDLVHRSAADQSAGFVMRQYSAELLARLGDARGIEVLIELLNSPAEGITKRCEVAVSLARADDSRGVNFLREIAADESLQTNVRRNASRWLRWLGDPQASRLFRGAGEGRRAVDDGAMLKHDELDIAIGVSVRFEDESATIGLETRMMARQALAHFSNSDSVRDLLAVATDQTARFDLRRQAIRSLAMQGATAELSQIAEERDADSTVRCWAAEEASWLGEPRGTEVLVSLVGSRAVDSYTRRRAAHFLIRLGDSRGTRLLADLATDPTTTVDARKTAAQLLVQLDYVGIFKDLILDPRTADSARLNAIDILAADGKTSAMAELRRDPVLPHEARQHAARAISHQARADG